MKENIKVVNSLISESNDKLDCFARISKTKCNALKEKKCKNCSFYKNRKDVPNYKKLFIKSEEEYDNRNKN